MPNVLILHECVDQKNYASEHLLARGFDVTTVSSSKEAISLLKRTVGYSLIIAPVHLETDDVFDLLRWVKGDNRHKNDPFIFFCIGPTDFTKTMSVGIEAAARVLGADAVLISDNFNADKFWELVEPLLSQKKDALNEREMVLSAKERQLDRREHDIGKREEGLDQREKFIHRREQRSDTASDA